MPTMSRPLEAAASDRSSQPEETQGLFQLGQLGGGGGGLRAARARAGVARRLSNECRRYKYKVRSASRQSFSNTD